MDFRVKHLFNDHCQLYHKVIVDVNPGDFVFFDSRLPHASVSPIGIDHKSLPDGWLSGVPEEYSKYVFYWDCGNGPSAKAYLQDAVTRCLSEQPGEEAARFDYGSRHYPEDYPGDLARMADANQVLIATPDVESCRRVRAHMAKSADPSAR
jgi:hypothetical protein